MRSAELARMQAEHARKMSDKCKVVAQTTTEDAYGFPTGVGVEGSEISCAYNPDVSRETNLPELVQQKVQAIVRLPIGTSVSPNEHIRITARHGTTVDILYRVVADPLIMPTHIKVFLTKVTL